MNFNLPDLEKKFKNLSIQSQSLNDQLNNNLNNFTNKKKIELILYVFFFLFNYYYNIRKNEYLKQISYFSENYLLGSDWYIGNEYKYENFISEMDEKTKRKMYFILAFFTFCHQKLD